MERFSLATVDSALLNLEQWPTVDEDALRDPAKQHFRYRCQAIRLLRDAVPRDQVLLKTGISGKTAMRLLKRCLALHPDGRIYGYRALIPSIHIVPYARRVPVTTDVCGSGTGASGAFTQLLRTHPKLEDLVRQHILKISKKQHLYESRIPLKSLHKRFLDECRKLNLDVGLQYPFNVKKLGCMSLSNYVHRFIEANTEKAASAMFGSNAAKKLRAGDGSGRPITKPFERVECDAHHIDAISVGFMERGVAR